MRLFLIIFSLTFLSSCQQKLKKVRTYYNNGNLKEVYFIDKNGIKQGKFIFYYENGNISYTTTITDDRTDTIYKYSKSTDNNLVVKRFVNEDSTIYAEGLYPNHIVHYKGLNDNKYRKIGRWYFFNESGDTASIEEYKIIDGKSYLNQMIVIDTTLYDSKYGHACSIEPETTKIKIGDSIRVVAKSTISSFETDRKKPDFYIIKPRFGKSFSATFSNSVPEAIDHELQDIELSIKYNLKNTLSKKILEGLQIAPKDYYKTVVFYYKPHKIGKDTIRGLFNEIIAETPGAYNLRRFVSTELDSDVIIERSLKTIYFDIPIEVVE